MRWIMAAMFLLRNTRKTDSLRRGIASGFLAVWRPAYAALALSAWPLALLSQSLNGVVLDHTASVLPGAQVTMRSLNGGGRRTIWADGEGKFRFDNLKPGAYELQASMKGGFLAASFYGLRVRGGKCVPSQIEIRLPVGDVSGGIHVSIDTTIDGVVLDGVDSAPNGLVCFESNPGRDKICTTTDRLGFYFARVPGGTYSFTVTVNGHDRLQQAVEIPPGLELIKNVLLPALTPK